MLHRPIERTTLDGTLVDHVVEVPIDHAELAFELSDVGANATSDRWQRVH